MDKIAVLIPCLNEEKTISKVVKSLREVLPEAVIYVYDNNSSDKTAQLAEKAGAIVRYEYMQGKGNVIRRMFREIDAQCYVITDGDNTYPAESAAEMAELVLTKNADMVIGDRLSSTYFNENKRPFHNAGNKLVRFSINSLFDSDIRDIMTGYRAFSYQFVKTFPVLCHGFEIETEMTIHAVDKNMRLENVVVDYKNRPEGSVSKLNTFQDGIKVINTIVRLWKIYKPLQFFSVVALLLMLITVGVFVPNIWIPYLETGLVDKIPTLIVCGFTVIAALLFYFSGIILSEGIAKEKREFEFRMHLVNYQLKMLKDK